VTTDVASGPATYRDLFAQQEYRTLFGAHVVSMLGTVAADVALTVLVYARTGSPLLAALTFTVSFLPFLIGGTLLSGIVDRMPARPVLVVCDLVRAALFAVMTLPGLPIAALLSLSFLAGLAAPIFGGTRSAILPDILGDGQRYVLGQATMRMISQGAQVIGFGVGGLLVAALGARVALGVDAVTFAVSAVSIRFGIRSHRPARAVTGSLVSDSMRGVRAVLGHASVRRILLLRWGLPSCALAPEALAAAYLHAVRAPASAIGVFLGTIPLAMVAVDLAAGRLLDARVQRRLIVPGALACEVPLLAFMFQPDFPLVLVFLMVIGLGYCHALGLDKLLIDTAPAALRGRVLAVDQAGLMVSQGIGFAVWGGIAEILPLHLTIAVAGCCGLAVVGLLTPGLGLRASAACRKP
jgi:MFS family permease